MAVTVFLGVFLVSTQEVFAIPCFDSATGIWTEVASNSDCSGGSKTLDPGSSNDNTDNSGGDITTIGELINALNRLMNAIVPFLVGLSVFVVIYGIFGYISHSAEEEKRAEARQFILWGVIFIFAMLSIWGLINLLSNTFSLDKEAPSVDSIFPTRD